MGLLLSNCIALHTALLIGVSLLVLCLPGGSLVKLAYYTTVPKKRALVVESKNTVSGAMSNVVILKMQLCHAQILWNVL